MASTWSNGGGLAECPVCGAFPMKPLPNKRQAEYPGSMSYWLGCPRHFTHQCGGKMSFGSEEDVAVYRHRHDSYQRNEGAKSQPVQAELPGLQPDLAAAVLALAQALDRYTAVVSRGRE